VGGHAQHGPSPPPPLPVPSPRGSAPSTPPGALRPLDPRIGLRPRPRTPDGLKRRAGMGGLTGVGGVRPSAASSNAGRAEAFRGAGNCVPRPHRPADVEASRRELALSPHPSRSRGNPRGAARARAPHQPSADKSPPTNRRPKGNRRPEFRGAAPSPGVRGTAGATPAHPQSKKPTLESRCPGMFRRRWGRRNVPPRDPAPGRSPRRRSSRHPLPDRRPPRRGVVGWATRDPAVRDPGCAIA
jgi:hypothetical protein